MEQNITIQGDTSITTDVKKALINEENTVPYRPISTLPSMGTVIPISLLGETLEAQSKLLAEGDDVDFFLMNRLKYRSKLSLSNAFRAEQADAVFMAIKQIERGGALILADQAGIGKGRSCAGVLRYAFCNGYLPVFITEKPNLFSDIYRDIRDIGGFGQKDGKDVVVNPFILNGFSSGGTEKDEFGNKIKKPSRTSIIDENGNEIITAPQKKEISDIIKSGKIPSEYNLILSTYSQLQGDDGTVRFKFLENLFESLDFKVILVLDECHNASGTKSDVGVKVRSMVASVSGCLFSSATFSKTPENMYLYSLKTDLSKANVPSKELLEIIKKGGERLIENMAAGLAKAGQLIRRERRFDNCNIEYQYTPESDDSVLELYNKYDTVMDIYRRMLAYFNLKNPSFYHARKSAIKRFVDSKKIEIVKEPKPSNRKELEEWKERNMGKYEMKYFTAGQIIRSRFNFIETLVFSLKADYVANETIRQLQNKFDNLTVEDKSIFQSNRKPIIAVRNTLEGLYNVLGVKVGDTITNGDFSVYIQSIIQTALNGVIKFKQIRKDKKEVVIEEDISIQLADFEDNGEYYNQLLSEVKAMRLDIPVSPIDHIIQKVQSVKRSLDDNYGGGDPYYRVGEVTGRTKRLIKQQDGTYTLIENPKDKNVANTFKKFNDGFYDVLLINESGSTGASAHSSIRYADQRPRVMIVHQVELDVNTEVQKRGRINRTGMVNYPTYVYIVSKIPSEIRRLLMLAKKLRKLDANTTGNQKQSEKLSEIKDNKGNAIQDIMNKYGDEVLNVFLEDPAHSQYTIYQKSDEAKGRGVLSGELEIESFVREIELARADEQKYFFDTINQLYIQKVEEKKQEGINDLETEILDLRASIKNRSILIQGENTSPFNSSVYAEDIFGFVQDNPLSKDEVDAFQLKLSSGRDPVEFYEEIKEDFKIVQEKTLEQIIKDIEVPDYKSAATEEEKDKIKQAYDNKIKKVTESFNKDKKKISDYLNFFKPNMPVAIPTIEEDCYETDESGNPKKVIEFNNGKFIGVKITSAAKHKYSPMNIEFVFCQLNGKPKVSYKPTTKGSFVLDAIMEKTKYIENFRLVSINNWVVDKNTRRLHRIITGNLIQGYSVAEDLITKYPESYGKSLEFLKFTTTYEGSIRYGIRMKMTPFKEIDVKASKTVYNINQQQFMDLLLSPDSLFVAVNSAQTVMFDCYNRQIYIRIFGGTTRKSKGEEREKKLYNSKLYSDPIVRDICNKYGKYIYNTIYSYKGIGASRGTDVNSLEIGIYRSDDDNMDFLKELLSHMYSIVPMKVEVRIGITDESLSNEEDLYLLKGESASDEEGKEYEYQLLKNYESSKEKLLTYSKFKEYIQGKSVYGNVILRGRASAIEASNYDLMPVNTSPSLMISDVMSVLDDTEKIKIVNDVKKAISDGKSMLEIGIIVQPFLLNKVLNLKSIFGVYYSIKFIGQLMSDFVSGNIKKTELPTEQEQSDEDGGVPKEEIELNMETAQDFIIYLTSKIS